MNNFTYISVNTQDTDFSEIKIFFRKNLSDIIY